MQKLTHHPIFWIVVILILLFITYPHSGLVDFIREIAHAISQVLGKM